MDHGLDFLFTKNKKKRIKKIKKKTDNTNAQVWRCIYERDDNKSLQKLAEIVVIVPFQVGAFCFFLKDKYL